MNELIHKDMILTDKAKVDFLKWYEIRNDNTLTPHELLYLSEDIVQYVLITEWLDSVEIYIEVGYWRNNTFNGGVTTKEGFSSTGTDIISRQEAIKAAIAKANEIYNKL